MTTLTAGMNSVLCDMEGGMQKLLSHILERRPSSVMYLSGPDGVYTLDCRRHAFVEAVADSGVTADVISLPSVDYTRAQDAVRARIGNLPDVVICVNDFMALGVVNLFAEYGIAVPDDIMIAGFDDIIFSVASPVPLTTVRQDLHEMADRTADLLLRMIKDPNIREDIRIPTELIIRKSTRKGENIS